MKQDIKCCSQLDGLDKLNYSIVVCNAKIASAQLNLDLTQTACVAYLTTPSQRGDWRRSVTV
jgi:hypothetical protein